MQQTKSYPQSNFKATQDYNTKKPLDEPIYKPQAFDDEDAYLAQMRSILL